MGSSSLFRDRGNYDGMGLFGQTVRLPVSKRGCKLNFRALGTAVSEWNVMIQRNVDDAEY